MQLDRLLPIIVICTMYSGLSQVVAGEPGAPGSCPPVFGRLVKPISTRRGALSPASTTCPPPPRIFRPCDGPGILLPNWRPTKRLNEDCKITITNAYNHRLENRCVLRHISNMNFHSWAVLGSWGCREKKIQTAISMQLLRPVFLCFHGQKNFLFFLKVYHC